jgi:protein kinase/serine/threonine-protein kinase
MPAINNLLEEIKARKIRKWVTIHLSTGLTLLGIINLFGSRYNFPAYIFDLFVVIIIFGLISVIILAWFHGKENHQKVTAKEMILHSTVVICAALGFIFYVGHPKSEPPAFESNSIAVLPFLNLSDSKEDEYFSDGVTEDILTQLSKIEKLKVVARTSVMKYKKTTKTSGEIGKELGVETILIGSVRRAGNNVRISCQLINTVRDKEIWAEYYDRQLSDIFLIQSDVAARIAAALKTELSSAQKEKLKWNPTKNVNAYGFYLEGREHYNRYKKDENEKAIDLFRKALNLDTNYALAYTGLADAYAQKAGAFGFGEIYFDSSVSMSNKAIQLSPELSEGYKSLGVVSAYKGKFRSAINYYSKALDLNPNYGPAINNISTIYWWLGKFDEAYPWAVKSVQIDPARASGYGTLGIIYLGLARDSAAEKWLLTSIDLQPNSVKASELIKGYIARQDYDRARKFIQTQLKENPGDLHILESSAEVELYSGDYKRARALYDTLFLKNPAKKEHSPNYAWLLYKNNEKEKALSIFRNVIKESEETIKSGNEEFNSPYILSEIYAVMGNREESLKWLQTSIDNGWRLYRISLIDPLLENIRNEEKFKRMMTDLKEKVAAMWHKKELEYK